MSIVLHARMEFRRMGVIGGLALLVLGLTRIPVAAQEGHTTMTSAGSVGFYAIHRTPGPIHVDGNLDELGWQMAEQINGFQRILNDYDRIENSTRAKMLWDDTALYLGFACEDPDVWAIFDGEDDPMWSEEVVETFIDPDGDGNAVRLPQHKVAARLDQPHHCVPIPLDVRPHSVISTNVVSSIHSPDEDFLRSLIARPISVTAEPFEIYRNSGSRVTFPMRNTRFILLAMAISLFPCSRDGLIDLRHALRHSKSRI